MLRHAVRVLLPCLLQAFVVICLVLIAGCEYLQAQANASSLIAQMNTAFSPNAVVQSVQLTGTATWYAGTLTDTGSATLAASSDGSYQVSLQLSSLGLKSEARTGSGLNSSCERSGANGTTLTENPENCWKPLVWFLPNLVLQPSVSIAGLSLADLGSGPVGNGDASYRHLRGQYAYSGSDSFISSSALKSESDLGLDSSTLLPSVLTFMRYPANSALAASAIEVHYSDYQVINGVQIPFRIQRYVNGSLQLDLIVSSAQIN